MKPSFGLYLHIPYCFKKCPYCDFNSYGIGDPASASMPETQYSAALLSELAHYAADDAWTDRPIHSIFFGGGTPSLFSGESFHYLLSGIRKHFHILPETEVTMETNPGTIHEDLGSSKLREIREAGVNRISLGVQSFSDRKRKNLGRWHSTEEIMQAIANIQTAGFSNYSFDFIFGVPEETEEEWTQDLLTAFRFSPRHISAYGLTIEPGTEFGRLHKKGQFQELDEEVQARLYEETERLLAERGYQRYEISNYAIPGSECRHNLGYWRNEDYLGLGAGAHSFLERRNGPQRASTRWVNQPRPEHYISAASTEGGAVQRSETLSEEQERIEFFFLRLRTSEGARLSEFEARFQEDFSTRYAEILSTLEQQGLLLCEPDRIALSKKGFLFSNSVFEAFAEKC